MGHVCAFGFVISNMCLWQHLHSKHTRALPHGKQARNSSSLSTCWGSLRGGPAGKQRVLPRGTNSVGHGGGHGCSHLAPMQRPSWPQAPLGCPSWPLCPPCNIALVLGLGPGPHCPLITCGVDVGGTCKCPSAFAWAWLWGAWALKGNLAAAARQSLQQGGCQIWAACGHLPNLTMLLA